MGKDYFEFLEEEFQALTTQLQQALGAKDCDRKAAETQFTRCGAVYQQMRVEAKRDRDFKDRLNLYKIQLEAFEAHYKTLPPPEVVRQQQEMVARDTDTLPEAAAAEEDEWGDFQSVAADVCS